jgi:hypothetical protein
LIDHALQFQERFMFPAVHDDGIEAGRDRLVKDRPEVGLDRRIQIVQELIGIPKPPACPGRPWQRSFVGEPPAV